MDRAGPSRRVSVHDIDFTSRIHDMLHDELSDDGSDDSDIVDDSDIDPDYVLPDADTSDSEVEDDVQDNDEGDNSDNEVANSDLSDDDNVALDQFVDKDLPDYVFSRLKKKSLVQHILGQQKSHKKMSGLELQHETLLQVAYLV